MSETLTDLAIGAYLVRPMSSSLHNRLSDLASAFSADVLDAIRSASLDELLFESSGRTSPTPSHTPARSARVTHRFAPASRPAPAAPSSAPAARRRGGRLARRSAGAISNAVEDIVGLLKSNPAGLRAEQIRQKLGLQAKELPRPLKEGLESGSLSKVGQKRATTYFAGGGRKVAPRAARAVRPVAKSGRGGPAKRRA